MKTWLKILAVALPILASVPSYGEAQELSFEEMSEIVGGGGPLDTCGDNDFSCPYEVVPDEEAKCIASPGTILCTQYKSYDQCGNDNDECDECSNGNISQCASYEVTKATWDTVMWVYSYCNYETKNAGNCGKGGFPKQTCE